MPEISVLEMLRVFIMLAPPFCSAYIQLRVELIPPLLSYSLTSIKFVKILVNFTGIVKIL